MKRRTFHPSIHILTLYVQDAAPPAHSMLFSRCVSDPVLGPGSMIAQSPDL